MSINLPLYHLFLELRNEGFSLGTEQYLLLIKVLHHKKYLLNLDIIRRTCTILWANSQEEAWILNRHFDLMVFSEQHVLKEMAEHPEISKKIQTSSSTETSGSKQNPAQERKNLEISKEEDQNKDTDNSSEGSTANEDTTLSDENLSALLPGVYQPFQMQGQEHFLLEGSISPITTRQMQQSWRYLRNWKREGAQTEIDLRKTFEEVAKRGFFTQPAKTAPRVNIIELLLLVDRNGSMLPFHGLLDELVLSALNGGRFQKASCLYFHDYPIKYLYRQPQLIEEIELSNLKNKLDNKRTVVMIISDAGAARNTFSEKRVKRTLQLKDFLKANTSRQVWLNPMPKQRWEGCSAEDIAAFFPMFEINKMGLYKSIDVLRGKASKTINTNRASDDSTPSDHT